MRTALLTAILAAMFLVPAPVADAQEPLLAIEFENGLTVALEQDQIRVGSFAIKLAGEADDSEHGVRRPSDFEELEVRSPSGERLGTFVHVLVNPRTGRVPYGVIERTNVGAADQNAEAEATGNEAAVAAGQRTIVPWRYFKWTEDPQQGPHFVLMLDRQALEGAPSYAEEAEPNFDQPRWHGAIDRYYENLSREQTAARDQLQPIRE